ncbi:MAG TPA: hypothetical protein VHP58_03840 [Alphaproteobacteria bacterium]|nr:hypothetical protein [Alphaproteobacteria bacterium]
MDNALTTALRNTMPQPFVPLTRYDLMFDTVADPATTPAVAPGAPRVWGTFRLAAWAWAGIDDVGPVILGGAPSHAYGVASAMVFRGFRNITTLV